MHTASYLPWQFINGEDVSAGILANEVNEVNCKCKAAQIEHGDDNCSAGVYGDTVSDHAPVLFDV
jgi:hypothetical protein